VYANERSPELRMRLTYWVFAFVHGFRFEAKKLRPEETECFEPHVKEQMLTRPCQVEVMQFDAPYRLALFFFFDKTKQDLRINVHQENWNSLEATISKLRKKYFAPQLNRKDLRKLLKRCRSYSNESIYSIDFVTHACCLSFGHDPRTKASPFPWSWHYITAPQKMAEIVFTLNLAQAQDEHMNKTFFT